MADLLIKGLTKTFGGVKALSNVNFEANFGDIHALLGENGAGKSTLIKCLGACLEPDRGEMILDGKLLTATHPKEAMSAGVGIVFQELSLIPNLSVADNIFLEMNMDNKIPITRKSIIKKATQELFNKYDIEGIDPDDKVDALSLSKRQIIEIVKVLNRDPKVVVFDEATSALSTNRVKWLLKITKRLQKENKLIIFISHRMGEIREFCNIVTVFRNGENVGTKKLEDTDNDELVTMMLGRKVTGYYPEKINYKREEIALETKGLTIENNLHDVNLKLHYGEVVGIGGLAGQGQNALLLSLFGAVSYQGRIILAGEPVRMGSPSQALKKGIALVPEDRSTEGLVQELSIADNLLLPMMDRISFGGVINFKKARKLLDNAVIDMEIKIGDLEDPVNSLSGGNQQKVVLAKLMMIQPKVLLLYDFTRGVDVGTKNTMFSLLRQLAKNGNCILFYSTDIEELVNVCDRVLVMDAGRIESDLSKEKLTQENILLASVGEAVS